MYFVWLLLKLWSKKSSVFYKSFPNGQRVAYTATYICPHHWGLPKTQKVLILSALFRQNGAEWLAKYSGSQKEEGVNPNYQSEIWKGQEQRSDEVYSLTLEVRMTEWRRCTLLTSIPPLDSSMAEYEMEWKLTLLLTIVLSAHTLLLNIST